MTTRREIVKAGAGLAAIIAAGKAPAALVRSLIAARDTMIMGRGDKSLPYDAEVEYLEGTGTQWIDTGIHGAANQVVECRFAATKPVSETGSIESFPFLARRGGRRMATVVRVGEYWGFGAMTALYSTMQADTSWHTVRLCSATENQSVMLDGNIVHEWSVSDSDETYQTIPLFAGVSTEWPPSNIGQGKIASFTVSDVLTGRLLISLSAVRFTNEQGVSEGAIYDRVSGQLFRNQGTGAFTIGPDI